MMRVGYIAWAITTRGAGIGPKMSGPFDLFWGFATYLLPLAEEPVLRAHLPAALARPSKRFWKRMAARFSE